MGLPAVKEVTIRTDPLVVKEAMTRMDPLVVKEVMTRMDPLAVKEVIPRTVPLAVKVEMTHLGLLITRLHLAMVETLPAPIMGLLTTPLMTMALETLDHLTPMAPATILDPMEMITTLLTRRVILPPEKSWRKSEVPSRMTT